MHELFIIIPKKTILTKNKNTTTFWINVHIANTEM